MSLHPRTARRGLTRAAVVLAALAVTGAGATASVAAPPGASSPALTVTHRHACAEPTSGHAACFALVDSDANGRALTPAEAKAADLHPYMAADLQSAYHLPSAVLGARQTIAIVDAFDDPNAESDLAFYRKANGLPACTSDFPCFRKVDQRGEETPPAAEMNWAVEISLDLDMASAACPNCQILLVEADDNSDLNLALAVDEAVKLGATIVSNSWGALEYNGELATEGPHFDHPGATILASSGDWGFGATTPASLPTVVSVGGTSLYQDSSARGWSETAWGGAGSGCSAYVAKPSWQKDKLCDKRTVADVSAVADPDTPVAIYDTFDQGGWMAAGGTSASAPVLAGIYALAGNSTTIPPLPYLYSHRSALHDVTAGSNGLCGGSYLCTAVRGYDGPTGLGTPNGIGAF